MKQVGDKPFIKRKRPYTNEDLIKLGEKRVRNNQIIHNLVLEGISGITDKIEENNGYKGY